MYNLMMTGGDNLWEQGDYTWDKRRILEYTHEEIAARYKELTSEDLKQLAALPTLFMYERGTEGVVRVGRVNHVQLRGGNEIRIIFEFDPTIQGLTFGQIEAIGRQLDITKPFEWTRNHWAVKDRDLYAVLREAGLAPPAVQPPPRPESSSYFEPPQTPKVTAERIFLVHGRNEGELAKVARFIETKVGLKVCVLAEQPNRGRTIITKFQEEAAGANYAVVLMTADDNGQLRAELSPNRTALPLQSRARQNVIFELGFFLGKLGADRVCVLLESGVEKPSDYDGVVYIPLDEHDGWQRRLVNELQAANVPVSPDWWRAS